MAAGFASKIFYASAFDGNSALRKCPPKPRCQGDQRHIDGGGKENHDDLD
ncbi:hypothetical protein SLEP1_g38162 [Rubroshorea leprosula]|uniref:Uncharacterized protein n=1 Tax=Rubroshorea leprosula TaxID=152421 RepID=A0AAV5KXK2_9ROSI|nr:hypothetical protein SLEP1_g38162 [Rubroshorea leprosula]